ncbi:hypothetical protein BH11PSE13_BH11PSE13_07400 [soil metagenome]
MAVSGSATFTQFVGVQPALMVASTLLVIHNLVGNLPHPLLTSKSSWMNRVADFIAVVFRRWLGSVWGLRGCGDSQEFGKLLSG